jgi:hypothetical protein
LHLSVEVQLIQQLAEFPEFGIVDSMRLPNEVACDLGKIVTLLL